MSKVASETRIRKTKTKPEKPRKPTLLETLMVDPTEISINKNNKFGSLEFQYVAQCISQNKITRLSLINVHLNDLDICVLAEALKSNTTLIELDISSNKFENHGLIALLFALKTHPAITKLNISDNKFSDYDEKAEIIKYFVELIKNNVITHLDISSTNISDTLAMAISNPLAENTSLKTFHCHHCEIGDIGQYFLARALIRNQNISDFTIDRKNYFITYENFKLFCEIWKNNKTINEFSLVCYDYEDKKNKDSFNRLLYLLNTNKNIEILKLYNSKFSYEMIKQLINYIPNTNIKILDMGFPGRKFNDTVALALFNLLIKNNNLLSFSLPDFLTEMSNVGFNYLLNGLRYNTSILNFDVISLPNQVRPIANEFLARNQLLYDNHFWCPREHLDFKQFDVKLKNTNKKINGMVMTSLMCNNAKSPYLPNLPIDIMYYIFSFYQRKMFYE